jgi:hypothetical protein
MRITPFARRISLGIGAALLALSAPASAHFLWMEIPNGSALQIRFSEEPEDPTLPNLLDRIQEADVRTGDGHPLATKKGSDALEADLPADARVVAASQAWGVLDRRDQGRGLFLLKYYAKAARDVEAASQSAKLPLEVFAAKAGSVLRLTVREDEKPVPGAEIWVRRPGDPQPLELKTDESGEADFEVSGSGKVQVRAMAADRQPGKLKDAPYDFTRSYSSLTFPVKGSDDADSLLQGVRQLRETWRSDFPGFTARVRVEKDGAVGQGTATIARDGSIDLKLDNSKLEEEARSGLASMVSHRMASGASPLGKNKPSFGAADAHPQGRSVLLNDPFDSMYRIRDGQIMQVNRTMGVEKFTTDVLRNTVLDNGKYLPAAYAVSFFDKDGKLERAESFSESYQDIEGYWLPSERRQVVSYGGDAPSVSALSLSDLRLTVATAKADPSK